LGRIDPGNRFPEFLEMCANVWIEHQPHRLGALTPCSQRGTAITAGQQKLHHRMNVTEWGCYTAPLIGGEGWKVFLLCIAFASFLLNLQAHELSEFYYSSDSCLFSDLLKMPEWRRTDFWRESL
jgi:hypothetical protein